MLNSLPYCHWSWSTSTKLYIGWNFKCCERVTQNLTSVTWDTPHEIRRLNLRNNKCTHKKRANRDIYWYTIELDGLAVNRSQADAMGPFTIGSSGICCRYLSRFSLNSSLFLVIFILLLFRKIQKIWNSENSKIWNEFFKDMTTPKLKLSRG